MVRDVKRIEHAIKLLPMVPKKIDRSKCEKHRGTTLLSVTDKVFDNPAQPNGKFRRHPTPRPLSWPKNRPIMYGTSRDTKDHC